MSLLDVRKYGDPILREKCLPVEEVNDTVMVLIDDMAETMYKCKAVGLSASQVGVKERVVVVGAGGKLIALVNPEIRSCGEAAKEIVPEGCLSIPGIQVDVGRAVKIVVEGLNRKGEPVQLTLEGLEARAMQHEIDHLNGILIIDYLSFVKRQLIKKQLAKIKGEGSHAYRSYER